MADDFIGIDVAGLEELKSSLIQLPDEVADAGVEAANEYLLDVERSNARRPYAGEPFVWSSDKQRRAYFASNGFGGGIPYKRTQTLSRGWKLLGYGKNQILVNEVSYAKWVKDIQYQIIGMFRRGWTVIQEDVKDRMDEIERHFEAGVTKALRKLGLGE